MKFTPFNRLLRMLELDRQDIIYVYVYAVLAGIITLSLPLGIQAIIGLIAGGSVSNALIYFTGCSNIRRCFNRCFKDHAIVCGGSYLTTNFFKVSLRF